MTRHWAIGKVIYAVHSPSHNRFPPKSKPLWHAAGYIIKDASCPC
jgi:hypothetical protein